MSAKRPRTKKIPEILDRKDSPILRTIAKPVAPKDVSSAKVKKVIRDMNIALDSQDDGVAIAAPQIGAPLRIFIIKGSVLTMKRGKDKKMKEQDEGAPTLPNMVFINPEFTKLSKKKQQMEEGCLSVRWLYGKVERSEKATVRALDENGAPFIKGGSGLLSQAFQHEMDHLNGILFIDKATEVEDHPPKADEHITE